MSFLSDKSLSPKKIGAILVIALAVVLGLLVSLVYLNAPKVVYIDAARVLQEYRGARDSRNAFEEKASKWQSNIDTLEREFEQAYAMFEANYKNMDAESRENRRGELARQQQKVQEYKQAMQQNAASEEQKLTQETVEDINRFLESYGKKQGYDFILIANQVGTIAYAREKLDVTDEVIEALNQAYRK